MNNMGQVIKKRFIKPIEHTVSKCCESGFYVMPNDPITDKIPNPHYICDKCDKPCGVKVIKN